MDTKATKGNQGSFINTLKVPLNAKRLRSWKTTATKVIR